MLTEAGMGSIAIQMYHNSILEILCFYITVSQYNLSISTCISVSEYILGVFLVSQYNTEPMHLVTMLEKSVTPKQKLKTVSFLLWCFRGVEGFAIKQAKFCFIRYDPNIGDFLPYLSKITYVFRSASVGQLFL